MLITRGGWRRQRQHTVRGFDNLEEYCAGVEVAQLEASEINPEHVFSD